MDLTELLVLVETEVTAMLRGTLPKSANRHWIILVDDVGVEAADVREDSPPPHGLLASLVDAGAHGAAYVTHLREHPERIVAQLLTANPRNSDVRMASVRRTSASVRLGKWEYTV